MRYDTRALDRKTLEYIRKRAVERVQEGDSVSRVARTLGVNRTSVYPWVRAVKAGGMESLNARKAPGKKRKLSPQEEKQLLESMNGKDPRDYGFASALWTGPLVASLIQQKFRINLSVPSALRTLHRIGLTPQKPLRRAYERNPEEVKKWTEERLPHLRARAKTEGKDLFFLDEAGVRSDEAKGRTWAPEGQRPEVAVSGERQSVNAISAVDPHGAFWFQLFHGSLDRWVFICFLLAFMLTRERPVLLVLDGHPAHRAKEVKALTDILGTRLELHFLPGYSPTLNPDEWVWGHLKTNGTAKYPLHSGESLDERVRDDLQRIQSNPHLLQSFFKAPGVGNFVD